MKMKKQVLVPDEDTHPEVDNTVPIDMKEHDHSSCNKLRWSTIRGHADFDNTVHIETEEQTRVFGTNESTGPFVDTTDPINMKEQEQVLVPDECIILLHRKTLATKRIRFQI